MKLLSLDPGSQVCGYALFGVPPGDGDPELLDAGRLVASLNREFLRGDAEWVRMLVLDGELQHYRRIVSLEADLRDLLRSAEPDAVAVEIPSGRFGTGAKHGARGSLTTYGLAAGRLSAICEEHVPHAVLPVTERRWTREAGTDKAQRKLQVAMAYGDRYQPDLDPGADVADAICLGHWAVRWIRASRHTHAGARVES